ncbi:MAG: DUF389 domain-containing protein [Candidatus Eremiobacteraeota bacterium]|nr:DUF389 domain-containing protein [Candidatus Eremiobacteraeota bacterium]
MAAAAWWKIHCTPEETQETLSRIRDNASPGPTYFVLLILSTLIAAYGLVSNSTATVIGAMIVAPLMGPILGLGLAVVRKDSETFYSSLFAEVVGVILVILTGMLVAFVVSPHSIDYALGEIVGRTRPTLYDLAIGFAAGLAGAYCTVHPRLQASVAGVAIAVALVPPLTVTGLTMAGALAGETRFEAPLGSFMLFFANFLTIELASIIVFLMAGMGELDAVFSRQGLGRSLIIKLMLLVGTGWFLTNQLHNLVRERIAGEESRRVLSTYLGGVKGARLESSSVQLSGQGTSVYAVVTSRQEIRPAQVADIEKLLNEALSNDYRPVTLSVRSISSTWASATEFLDEPPQAKPDPEAQRRQAFNRVFTEALSNQPIELESFRLLPDSEGARRALVTVIAPYAMSPPLVRELEKRVNDGVAKESVLAGPPVKLTVRSVVIRSANADQDVPYSAPDTRSQAEKDRLAFEAAVRERLTQLVASHGGSTLLEAHVSQDKEASTENLQVEKVRLVLQAPKLLAADTVTAWEKELGEAFSNETIQREFQLEIEQRLGATIGRSLMEEEARKAAQLRRIEASLSKVVSSAKGRVDGQPVVSTLAPPKPDAKPILAVGAVVVTPTALKPEVVKKWEKSLQSDEPDYVVKLAIDNRIGRLLGP